mmetsp:Transcript_3655/g.8101  ORF Transcript_3655/g.8101 Transcript_3655/m.8101 type:complete len:301 (+) Transcript_3655:289-1191(+)
MLCKPCLFQHVVRISTHGKNLPLLHVMMIIQSPSALKPGNGPLINHRLTVILAMGFQTIQLKQPIGRRVKLQVLVPHRLHPLLNLFIFHRNRCILHQPWILEPTPLGHILEIIPIQRPAQTLSPENLVLLQLLRNTPGRINIRKVQLSSRLQETMTRLQDRLLIRAQIDHAVGNDDVDTPILQTLDVIQFLDQPQMKLDVIVPELLGVIRLRLPRHLQLLLRHIDSNHPSLRSDQLRGDVNVPSGPAAQVEDGHTLDFIGNAESAAVVFGDHGRVDVGDGGADVRGGRGGGAAGVGLEVL